MDSTDDRPDHPLPVTAEVGSEGGSYAEETMQNETFERTQMDRPAGHGGASSVATYAIDREAVAAGGIGATASGGMKRYPTEPPAYTGEDRRSGSSMWRFGLVGAAAGLAVGFLAARRK